MYTKDNKNGHFEVFFENGKLFMISTYKNDNLDGISKKYYESGKLIKRDVYKNAIETKE